MPEQFINGFLGGVLIGLAAVILFLTDGRIMGVSGIVSRLCQGTIIDWAWRLAFVAGLMVSARVFHYYGFRIDYPQASLGVLIVAGLCVGMGTALANGCTSGHGICGLARFSKRSLVAVISFMLAGMVTMLLMRLGGWQ